jgi:hypothetical protein
MTCFAKPGLTKDLYRRFITCYMWGSTPHFHSQETNAFSRQRGCYIGITIATVTLKKRGLAVSINGLDAKTNWLSAYRQWQRNSDSDTDQGEAFQRKHTRCEPGGGQAYDYSADYMQIQSSYVSSRITCYRSHIDRKSRVRLIVQGMRLPLSKGTNRLVEFFSPEAWKIQFPKRRGLRVLEYRTMDKCSICDPDRICCRVVRVPGYRSRSPGLISGSTRFSEKWWVWNEVHSASWVQQRSYLKEESSGSGLENRDYCRRDPQVLITRHFSIIKSWH